MTRLSVCLLCFALGLAVTIGITAEAPAQVVKQNPPNAKVDPKAKVVDPKAKVTDPKNKVTDPKAKVVDPKAKAPTPTKPAPPKTTAPTPPPKTTTPKPAEPETPLPPAEEPVGLPSPLRLAQGLRDQGLADLAIRYLDGLDPKTLPETDRAAIPLEKAKSKLARANEEADEAARTALLGQVRTELTAFVKANATHPRRAEASLSLARLISLEAKARLQAANRMKDKVKQKAERTAVRGMFTEASKEYANAAKGLATQLDSMPDSVIKRGMQREKTQAELDSAINLYDLYDTFPSDEDATVAERKARADTLTLSRKAFEGLAGGPSNSPNVWIAKAWMAEVDTRQQRPEAKAEIEEINRFPGGAAEAGRRLVRYFEVRRTFDSAGQDAKSLGEVQNVGKAWLAKYDSARRPSPEGVHVKYMVALSLEFEARGSMGARAPKGSNKVLDPNPNERGKLVQAERYFRDVAQTENEYSERAGDHRITVVRLLIGEAVKPPKDYLKFEDAHMAALVQQSKVRDAEKAETPDKNAIEAAKARLISLLERARSLATPADSPTDVVNDQINLAAMYLTTGRPYEAAVLGEHLARAPKPVAGRSSVAGELALAAYLAAASRAPEGPDGDDARKSDRERAIRIGRFVDEKYPADNAADAVRYKLGYLHYADGKPVEAFDLLSRIRPNFTMVSKARTLEGLIAHQLLIPADSPLPAARKVPVYRLAIADLEKIPTPPADTDSEDVKEYAQLRIRLCLLHLLKQRIEPKTPPSFDKVEQVAVKLISELEAFKELTPEHRLEMELLAKDMMTRSIFLQSVDLLDKGNFDELFKRITPILDDVDKAGPATAKKMKEADGTEKPLEGNVAKLASGYDADRRDVVLLALKGHIRKGAVDEANKQLDRLERLGGSIDTNLSTLGQLVNEIRGQIVTLRKENKAEEAKALTDGFAQLIGKITGKETVKPAVRVFAGQALVAVERFADAAAELSKVPAVTPAELAAVFAELPKEKQDEVRFYRAAALYRMRALRQALQFPDADKLVAEVVGTKEKPGWGYNNTEYKREAFLLAETKAANTPPGPGATRLWGEAVQGWGQLAGIQRTRLKMAQDKQVALEKKAMAEPNNPEVNAALNSARSEAERAKGVYFEYFFETQRCSLQAYQSVFKADNEKMKQKYESEAQKIVGLEKQNPDLASEVRAKYAEMLDREDMKDLKAAYQAAGGKMFLAKPEAGATGGQ